MALLDHLVYAVLDLETAIDEFEQRTGVRPAMGGRHLGVGTHNALASLGDGAYLELIAADPLQDRPALPRPFGLDGLTAPRLTGWAVRCTDITATVAAARARGYDPGDPIDMQRTTPGGDVLRWRLTLASAGGGVIPFLIDWGVTPHPSSTTPAGLRLAALHVEHPDPATITTAFAALDLHCTVVEAAEPAIVTALDGPHGRVELR
jgi:Glyoxalase-like domain